VAAQGTWVGEDQALDSERAARAERDLRKKTCAWL
jgi:hypothetical protein